LTAVRFEFRSSTGEVVDAIGTLIDGVEDLRPFFEDLRPIWYESRRELYASQGDSTDTPWPTYDDTPEAMRYVWAKASILGMPPGSRAPNSDVLLWGGPARLHDAVVGESSEALWETRADGATVTIDVPYASDHDEGKGVAPEWAWPKDLGSYDIPRRRLLSPAGDFVGAFSGSLGSYLAEHGGSFGLKASEAQAEIRSAFRAAATRANA
jgi:hypothetical protein